MRTLIARGRTGKVQPGINNQGEHSFFSAAEVVVWNRVLSESDMRTAAMHLTSYLNRRGAQTASATQGSQWSAARRAAGAC